MATRPLSAGQTQPPPHQFTSPYAASHPHPMQTRTLPLTLISLLTFLFSIPILVMGIWLAARHHADCLRFLQAPLIVIGILMMLASLIGLSGAIRRLASLVWAYLLLMTLLLLLLLAFTIFAFVVTRGSHGHSVWGARFKEYQLGDYSHWMRHKMSHFYVWDRIRWCVMRDGVCGNMNNKYPTQSVMWQSKLSYIESGCCKPPTACSFTFVTATNWISPASAGANADCGRWSNDPMQLCYNCDSCKAGVIRQVNKDWLKAAKVMLAMLVVLSLLYLLAWAAFLQSLLRRPHPTTTTTTTDRI